MIAIQKMRAIERMLLLATGLLAAHQLAFGIEGVGPVAMVGYTIAFGTLLIAGLLLLILGFETVQSSLVTLAVTVVPLGLSLGLVSEFLPDYCLPYLIFSILGMLAVAFTRKLPSRRARAAVVAGVHGVAGLAISTLPLIASLDGRASGHFSLVSVGGLIAGVAGLLLIFSRSGRPLLAEVTLQRLLPVLLLLASVFFMAGFSF